MTEGKERRQRAIADLIRSGGPSSQEDLAERLAKLGFWVTQATISRDLEQIGAIRIRRDGRLGYALPDEIQTPPAPQLAALLRDFMRSIESAANLVVIKTPPGSAHLIGVALDQAELPEIIGTICGDDTIFVACSGAEIAAALARRLGSGTANLQEFGI